MMLCSTVCSESDASPREWKRVVNYITVSKRRMQLTVHYLTKVVRAWEVRGYFRKPYNLPFSPLHPLPPLQDLWTIGLLQQTCAWASFHRTLFGVLPFSPRKYRPQNGVSLFVDPPRHLSMRVDSLLHCHRYLPPLLPFPGQVSRPEDSSVDIMVRVLLRRDQARLSYLEDRRDA